MINTNLNDYDQVIKLGNMVRKLRISACSINRIKMGGRILNLYTTKNIK